MAVSILIKRILRYSATNSSAKPPLPYSTLKPDTSSDSPSAKSKGARLVSARVVINHKSKVGNRININQICACANLCRARECIKINGIRRIRAIETS